MLMVLFVCFYEVGMFEMFECGKISNEVCGYFLVFRCIYFFKGVVYKYFWFEVRMVMLL